MPCADIWNQCRSGWRGTGETSRFDQCSHATHRRGETVRRRTVFIRTGVVAAKCRPGQLPPLRRWLWKLHLHACIGLISFWLGNTSFWAHKALPVPGLLFHSAWVLKKNMKQQEAHQCCRHQGYMLFLHVRNVGNPLKRNSSSTVILMVPCEVV